MGKLLDAAINNAQDRRRFLSKAALFGAAACAAAGLRNVENNARLPPITRIYMP